MSEDLKACRYEPIALSNESTVVAGFPLGRAINASPSLRNKKDLIEQFVDSVSTKAKVDAQWQAFVAKKQTVLDKLAAVFWVGMSSASTGSRP
jgi:hypothetical protein